MAAIPLHNVRASSVSPTREGWPGERCELARGRANDCVDDITTSLQGMARRFDFPPLRVPRDSPSPGSARRSPRAHSTALMSSRKTCRARIGHPVVRC